MAATILVLYENAEGKSFDLDYYMAKHMPMVGALFTPHGLKSWRVVKSAGTVDGSQADFSMAAILEFDSPDQFQAAVRAEGEAVFGDVPNFTDITPKLMISELVGTS